jgi:hypothetical protein
MAEAPMTKKSSRASKSPPAGEAPVPEAIDIPRMEPQPAGKNERLAWIWCAVFCTCAAALILSTVITVIRTYTPLPKWDYWAEILWLKDLYAGTWHFSDLWRQHNEHRILFPRLFFLTDLLLFKGTNVFLLAATLLLQAGNAWIFVYELWGLEYLSRQIRATLMGITLALFFSGLHLENFTWSFQVSFILVQLAATTAIWCLAWYREDPHQTGRLALALLSGVVATYSLASGLLIWPALLIVGVGLRIRLRPLLVLASSGVAIIALFLTGLGETPGSADATTALRHPVSLLRYACDNLALPVWALNHAAGEAVGAAILALVIWQVCWFLWRRPQVSRFFGLCLGIAVFVTATAFLTSLGRSIAFPEQAFRYATPVSLLWVALICGAACHPRWGLRNSNLAAPALLGCVITTLVVVILPDHIQQIQRFSNDYSIYQDTESAFASGIVYAAPPVSFVLPLVERNYMLVDLLRQHRLSVFSGTPPPLGESLEAHYTIVSGSLCQGVWESSANVDDLWGGAAAGSAATGTGWAWDSMRNRRPRSVLIADNSKIIRGLARFDRDRVDVAEGFRNSAMESSGWFGYFRQVKGVQYKAYAVLDDGKSVCPLGNRKEATSALLTVYRKGVWWIDSNRSLALEPEDRTISFGLPDDIPVIGDWDGSGVFRIGVFRGGLWILDWKNTGKPEDARTFSFGLPGDIPVVGDWGHTGVSKFGVFRQGVWILDWNGNHAFDSSDRQFSFGLPGDQPVVGDWDDSGVVRIGVFRRNQWHLDIRGSFKFDGNPTVITFGAPGDQPVVGDWTGWGATRLGVYRNGQWIMRTSGVDKPNSEQTSASFGLAGDIAIPWPVKANPLPAK